MLCMIGFGVIGVMSEFGVWLHMRYRKGLLLEG